MKKAIFGICAGICIAACLAFTGQVTNPVTGGGPPTGACGGDLGGTYPNCTVTGSHIATGGAAFTTPISASSSTVTPAITATSTYSADNAYGVSEFAPNITTGHAIWHQFGKDTGLGNHCDFAYDWVGNGFNNNFLGCYNGGAWMFRAFNNGDFEVSHLITATNCADATVAPACGDAGAGQVVIAVGATSVVVADTRVTTKSEIHITADDSISTALGVTCNNTLAVALAGYGVIGRVPGTSFTIGTLGTITINPACYSFTITN